MKNNMMSELPPAYRPEGKVPKAPSQQIYRIDQSGLPEFLKDNRALEEHFERVGIQRSKIMEHIRMTKEAAAVAEISISPETVAPLSFSPSNCEGGSYHYSNAWDDDQTTMNSIVSFDYRIEPVQNSALPYVVSKEEQLAIATKFLSKLDRVIAQSEKALQR
ncbi:hypothetical protein BH10CYA1_BH10CYA1_18520 [soil metagenome]